MKAEIQANRHAPRLLELASSIQVLPVREPLVQLRESLSLLAREMHADDPNRWLLNTCLSSVLFDLFRIDGHRADVELALSLMTEVPEPDNKSNRRFYHFNLARICYGLALRDGDEDLAELAVRSYSIACRRRPSLRTRRYLADSTRLRRRIRTYKTIARSQYSSRYFPAILNELRFRAIASLPLPPDSDRVLDAYRSLSGRRNWKSRSSYAAMLNRYSLGLRLRHDRRGNQPGPLREGLLIARWAASIVPNDALLQSNYGVLLRMAGVQEGDVDLLREAAEVCAAVRDQPVERARDSVTLRWNAAVALKRWFSHGDGTLSDLDAAIGEFSKLASEQVDEPGLEAHLAECLNHRYLTTREMTDLRSCIELAEEALRRDKYEFNAWVSGQVLCSTLSAAMEAYEYGSTDWQTVTRNLENWSARGLAALPTRHVASATFMYFNLSAWQNLAEFESDTVGLIASTDRAIEVVRSAAHSTAIVPLGIQIVGACSMLGSLGVESIAGTWLQKSQETVNFLRRELSDPNFMADLDETFELLTSIEEDWERARADLAWVASARLAPRAPSEFWDINLREWQALIRLPDLADHSEKDQVSKLDVLRASASGRDQLRQAIDLRISWLLSRAADHPVDRDRYLKDAADELSMWRAEGPLERSTAKLELDLLEALYLANPSQRAFNRLQKESLSLAQSSPEPIAQAEEFRRLGWLHLNNTNNHQSVSGYNRAVRFARDGIKLLGPVLPGSQTYEVLSLKQSLFHVLAAALQNRYDLTGNEADLTEALTAAGQAGSDGEVVAAVCRVMRFELHGRSNDLEEAIEIFEGLADEDQSINPSVTAEFATALRLRAELNMDGQDAVAAADLASIALNRSEVADRSSTAAAFCRQAMAGCLVTLGNLSGESSFYDAALEIAATSDVLGSPAWRRGALRQSIQRLQLELYSIQMDGDWSRSALKLVTETVESADRLEFDRCDARIAGASVVLAIGEVSGEEKRIGRGLRMLEEAVSFAKNSRDRARARYALVRALAGAEDWVRAYQASHELWQDLADMKSPLFTRKDRAWLFREFEEAAPIMVSTAIACSELRVALEWFARGQALLGVDLADKRDAERLRLLDPKLYEDLQAIVDQADGDSRPSRGEGGSNFEGLLEQVRQLPGLGHFMRTDERPLDLRPSHPLIVVNLSPRRLDVLVAYGEQVLRVPLDPSFDEVRDHASGLRALVSQLQSDYGPELDAQFAEELSWFWTSLADPILSFAKLSEMFSSEGVVKPRVTWSGSGTLSSVPWHAVGTFKTDGGTHYGVLDEVVSSYCDNLLSLETSRERIPRDSHSHEKVVVVMPETPGHPDLSFALGEANLLVAMDKDTTRLVGGPSAEAASFATVMSALRSARRVHFACHSHFDPLEPERSALVLRDFATRPLSALELSRAYFPGAEFAYLSACATAAPGVYSQALGLHLCGALQAAGFRHIVGTLWPVWDDASADVARAFYLSLADDADDSGYARALDAAIRAERLGWESMPSRWAGFVHVGP